jgi:hypothetical protein
MIAVNDLAFVLRTAIEFGVVEVLCLVGVLSAVRVDLLGGRHQCGEVRLFDGVRHGVAVHTARRGNEPRLAAHAGMFSSQRPGHFARTPTSVVPTNWSGTNARVVTQ